MEGEWGLTAYIMGFLFVVDENILTLDSGEGCISL